MRYIKSLKDFLLEKQTDVELVDKIEAESQEENWTCPRCGCTESDCICRSEDYGSTVNLFRINKGQNIKK